MLSLLSSIKCIAAGNEFLWVTCVGNDNVGVRISRV